MAEKKRDGEEEEEGGEGCRAEGRGVSRCEPPKYGQVRGQVLPPTLPALPASTPPVVEP